jgi:hypothetical protein
MKSLANEPGVGAEPERSGAVLQAPVHQLLGKRQAGQLKFDRDNGGWTLSVNYEVRRPLIGNLDVVGKFDPSGPEAGAGDALQRAT